MAMSVDEEGEGMHDERSDDLERDFNAIDAVRLQSAPTLQHDGVRLLRLVGLGHGEDEAGVVRLSLSEGAQVEVVHIEDEPLDARPAAHLEADSRRRLSGLCLWEPVIHSVVIKCHGRTPVAARHAGRVIARPLVAVPHGLFVPLLHVARLVAAIVGQMILGVTSQVRVDPH